MQDPYKILETKSTATDAEIKKAFIELKNKYDPDNYEKPNLKQIASEKTKEIEQAFDEIMNKRRLDRLQSGKSTFDSSKSNFSNHDEFSSSNNNSSPDFAYIESLLNLNRLDEAQNLLNSVNENERPAEWFYLKGLLLFKKGWLEEALNFLNAAVRMNPTNKKYAATLQQIRWQRSGNFGPFSHDQTNQQSAYPQTSSCSFCDACAGMMCANAICSCCEDNAMGGC